MPTASTLPIHHKYTTEGSSRHATALLGPTTSYDGRSALSAPLRGSRMWPPQGAVADIQGAIATGKVTAASWPSFLRATGKLHDLPVTVVTEEQIKEIPELKDKTPLEIVTERQKGDGLYMIGNAIFQVEGGTPTQIV